jgi:hypothetical protein
VWFYDLDSKRLYPVPHQTIAPEGHGVRAIVLAYAGEEAQPAKRKIAYLEKYAPDLKQLLEKARSDQAARRLLKEPIPSRDSPFFLENTLVSRVAEIQWHAIASPEGQHIASEWRSWIGPQGQRTVVVVP